MTIAMVTIAAGRGAHLRRQLDGLRRQDCPADEIVVVDLRPTDPAVARVVDEFAGVRRAALPVADGPLRLSAGRNLGALTASSSLLVFLDVDCIPAPDLVARYRCVLTAHPGRIACGPVRYLRRRWRAATVAELVAASDEPPARPEPSATELRDDHDLFWSLSFGVTSSTWRSLGGFDERFVGYGAEDTDFARRARQRGIGLTWFRGGTAFHQWHPPSRFDPGRCDELVANARRFHERWGDYPMHGWLRELDACGEVRFEPERDLLERRDRA